MENKSIRIRTLKNWNLINRNKESSSHYIWRKKVIDGYHYTNRLWRKALDESKTSRIKLEKSCDEVRKVINTWSDYGDRFRECVHNLSVRIEDNEREEDERRQREEAARQLKYKYRINRPTKLTMWRMREKYIPEPTLPPFKFQRNHIYIY